MEALVKASRQKAFKGVPDKLTAVAPGKLELHQPTRYASLSKGGGVLTQTPKAPEQIAADILKQHDKMLMIQPSTSPKPPIPEAARYNFSYKNGCAEFSHDSNTSDSNLLNEPVSNVPGLSKTPRDFKLAELRTAGKFSPTGNSKHTSPSRRSNKADKASKPPSSTSGSPVLRLQELEEVKRPSKLEKNRKSHAKRTPMNDTQGVNKTNSIPVDFNALIALESAEQRLGHDVSNAPGKPPGKENSGEASRCNATTPPDDLAYGISSEPSVGDTDVSSLRRIRRPAPRLKVRDNNSSDRVGIAKKGPPLSNFEAAEGSLPPPVREGGGKGVGDRSPMERRAAVSPSQQPQAKRLPLANATPRRGGGSGKGDQSRSPQGACRSRGGILPPLAMADRRRGSVGSDKSQSPQLSVMEVSSLPQGGVDGKEVSKERARPAGDGVGQRAPPLSTNSKLERLQQQLQSQDAKMRLLQKKERSWEEQVKQLKVELRNAREKERVLCKIVGIDHKLPRRAETAPDPPCAPKEKPYNGAGFGRRPHELRKSPPSDGVRPRVCDNKSDFLKAHIFSRNTFRAITAPDLPDVGSHKSYSSLRTTVRPLLNSLVPSYNPEGNDVEEIDHSVVGSLKLASLNTRQTALCLPHEADTVVTPVGIHFGHLMQFVNAQIITHKQAKGLWKFLCARKKVVHEGEDAGENGFGDMDATAESAAGKVAKGAALPPYNTVLSSTQSRSSLREYGNDHFESAQQQVPVLTKALRRKIEDLHLKNSHPKISSSVSEKEEVIFDGAPPSGSRELTTESDFSLVSTNNTMDRNLCSESELEKDMDIIHLPEFQGSLEKNVGYS